VVTSGSAIDSDLLRELEQEERTLRQAEFASLPVDRQALWRRSFVVRGGDKETSGTYEIRSDGSEQKLTSKDQHREYVHWLRLQKRYGNPPGFTATVVRSGARGAAADEGGEISAEDAETIKEFEKNYPIPLPDRKTRSKVLDDGQAEVAFTVRDRASKKIKIRIHQKKIPEKGTYSNDDKETFRFEGGAWVVSNSGARGVDSPYTVDEIRNFRAANIRSLEELQRHYGAKGVIDPGIGVRLSTHEAQIASATTREQFEQLRVERESIRTSIDSLISPRSAGDIWDQENLKARMRDLNVGAAAGDANVPPPKTPEEIRYHQDDAAWRNRKPVQRVLDWFARKQPPQAPPTFTARKELDRAQNDRQAMVEAIERQKQEITRMEAERGVLDRKVNEKTQALADAVAARRAALEREEAPPAAIRAIKALDANMKKYLPTWARLAIGGTIVGASVLTGAYAPALAGYIFATACAWRAASSVTTAVAVTTLTHGHFEKKGWRGGSVAAVTAGLGAGAGLFLLGPMLSQWLGITGPDMGGKKTGDALQAVAEQRSSGRAEMSEGLSGRNRPPGLALDTQGRPRYGYIPASYRAPAYVPITPSIARYGIDGLADVHFFGRCGLFQIEGFSTGAKEQFKDALRRTLVDNPEYAKRLLGYQGDPRDLIRGRDMLFPNRGAVNMGLFSDRDFMTDLRSNILRYERSYFTRELGGPRGVNQFIGIIAGRYER
jgi:VIT1/CCC1 family predicted Fe2+/Mn2+ transporter